MNIAGVLVHAQPNRVGEVRDRLTGFSGVEVHGETRDGRLIVTVEDTAEANASDTLLALHRVEGVIAAALVYHQFEPTLSQFPTERSGDTSCN